MCKIEVYRVCLVCFVLFAHVLFLINAKIVTIYSHFVLNVCKKTNIQLNIDTHNTLHNNLGMYSKIIYITI